ncbi:cytochrome c oxidase assembly protein COX19-like isoform X1 [Haliotis rubra]|uniref:cytochrome c oxidase assembly protein COX19-like isoform X1 n=1 Tax=Haliotis rubra TaxID=36100 RepID=UPI001EE5D01E|nr:cytochrome c oxidase assembly protein COX19-like isoform X1 [Haliotis rubra]
MATQMTFQRRGNAKPPDKGSFPLDHEGECKDFMFKYMQCLRINKHSNSQCRDESKDYLQCRMDRNLMTKESWEKLGYTTDSPKDTQS